MVHPFCCSCQIWEDNTAKKGTPDRLDVIYTFAAHSKELCSLRVAFQELVSRLLILHSNAATHFTKNSESFKSLFQNCVLKPFGLEIHECPEPAYLPV